MRLISWTLQSGSEQLYVEVWDGEETQRQVLCYLWRVEAGGGGNLLTNAAEISLSDQFRPKGRSARLLLTLIYS
jgi:hypothetical protein